MFLLRQRRCGNVQKYRRDRCGGRAGHGRSSAAGTVLGQRVGLDCAIQPVDCAIRGISLLRVAAAFLQCTDEPVAQAFTCGKHPRSSGSLPRNGPAYRPTMRSHSAASFSQSMFSRGRRRFCSMRVAVCSNAQTSVQTWRPSSVSLPSLSCSARSSPSSLRSRCSVVVNERCAESPSMRGHSASVMRSIGTSRPPWAISARSRSRADAASCR